MLLVCIVGDQNKYLEYMQAPHATPKTMLESEIVE